MLWKSGNFKQQNFTWKLKVSDWNRLKVETKFAINEVRNWKNNYLRNSWNSVSFTKASKKWSKSTELCFQKKDKKWYWPSFYFEAETKTFNEVKVLTETSDLIAKWKILFMLSTNANDTKVAINWKKCVYNAVEKVPDARLHFEKENPLTK